MLKRPEREREIGVGGGWERRQLLGDKARPLSDLNAMLTCMQLVTYYC